jgi:fatty-acyl-CoA synthase
MGRKKEMLISGGENIYPLEVEQVLQSHSAVSDVAVVGIPDPRWGEVPGAAVVLKEGHGATAEELTAWCRARLASYKTPRRWLILTALPRTAIGKVIKPQLVSMIQEGE